MTRRRVYTEEESLAFMAGKKARKENYEFDPAFATVPKHLRGAWYKGWKRGGWKYHISQVNRRFARNANALSQSPHMVRTEVETLEEACDVILRERLQSAAVAAKFALWRKRSLTLKQELALLKIRQNSPLFAKPITLPHVSILDTKGELPPDDVGSIVRGRLQETVDAINDTVRAARERVQKIKRDSAAYQDQLQRSVDKLSEETVDSLHKAIASLAFGIEELLSTADPKLIKKSKIKTMANLVQRLARAVGMPEPEFTVSRKPLIPSQRLCENCGDPFVGTTALCDRCVEISPAHQDTIKRREHEHMVAELEGEARALAKAIDNIGELL